jgi:hypothetical protein
MQDEQNDIKPLADTDGEGLVGDPIPEEPTPGEKVFRSCSYETSATEKPVFMDVVVGAAGLNTSWQGDFPATPSCCRCGGDTRHAFTASEGLTGKARQTSEEAQFVCSLHDNGGEGDFWPHDALAVAVYFCKDCLEPTALYNQA